MGLQLEPVELQVDLDPLPEAGEFGQEPVVTRDPDAVRVEDDARHVSVGGRPDDLGDLRMDRRLAAGQHQRVDPPALARDRRVERPEDVREAGMAIDPGAAVRKARRAMQIAVLGDVDEQDAAVLGLEIAEAIHVAHRDGTGVAGRVGRDLTCRDAPLLEVLPEGVILLVEARHLAVAAAADAAQIDGAVHRDEVALEDVRLVVDLPVGVLAEAAAADGQDHPQRGVRPQREHQGATEGGDSAGTAGASLGSALSGAWARALAGCRRSWAPSSRRTTLRR